MTNKKNKEQREKQRVNNILKQRGKIQRYEDKINKKEAKKEAYLRSLVESGEISRRRKIPKAKEFNTTEDFSMDGVPPLTQKERRALKKLENKTGKITER